MMNAVDESDNAIYPVLEFTGDILRFDAQLRCGPLN